jgi:periplasmic divalent cation tolerance protein
MAPIIIFCTCGNLKQARKISKDLIVNRLAACVNILPIASYYRWKGKLVNDHEYLLMIKTRSARFSRVRKHILALHSYELPEIVSLLISSGHKDYLNWIDRETQND